jgi:succinate dehydrogenase / fumarate reductase cytochrome b subunit
MPKSSDFSMSWLGFGAYVSDFAPFWGLNRKKAVKSNRPVNLPLSQVLAVNLKSPVAIVSILHRISGVVIFLLVPVLLYVLQASLASAESFAAIKQSLGGVVVGGLVFIALAGLLFHFVAGVKHLIMDFGIGETLQGGRTFAWASVAVAAVLILAAFVWMVA